MSVVPQLRRRSARLVVAAALALIVGLLVVPSDAASSKKHKISFRLYPNPAVAACSTRTGHTASVKVEVERGDKNDELELQFSNLKPHTAFDLFTVQNSPQLANGTPNPAFTNFGLAWYQSDLESNSHGSGSVHIRTILLDQIFGFDAGHRPCADQHVPCRVLVQRPGGRRAMRLHGIHALQRRAPCRPACVHQPARRHDEPRSTLLGPFEQPAERLQPVARMTVEAGAPVSTARRSPREIDSCAAADTAGPDDFRLTISSELLLARHGPTRQAKETR